MPVDEAFPAGSRALSKAEWSAAGGQKPDVSFLPAMERRRLSLLERAALSVAWRALEPMRAPGADASALRSLPVVFASRRGELGTTMRLMRQMFEEGEMSPAGFASSVHNAAPGRLSLALGDTAPYTAVAAGDRTREAGLLEASTTPGLVLFICAEEGAPEGFAAGFPGCGPAHAEAILFQNELQGGTRCAPIHKTCAPKEQRGKVSAATGSACTGRQPREGIRAGFTHLKERASGGAVSACPSRNFP